MGHLVGGHRAREASAIVFRDSPRPIMFDIQMRHLEASEDESIRRARALGGDGGELGIISVREGRRIGKGDVGREHDRDHDGLLEQTIQLYKGQIPPSEAEANFHAPLETEVMAA